jgi:hypothetical protein
MPHKKKPKFACKLRHKIYKNNMKNLKEKIKNINFEKCDK